MEILVVNFVFLLIFYFFYTVVSACAIQVIFLITFVFVFKRELEFEEASEKSNGSIGKDAISQRLQEIYKRLELIDADSAEARAASILAVSTQSSVYFEFESLCHCWFFLSSGPVVPIIIGPGSRTSIGPGHVVHPFLSLSPN